VVKKRLLLICIGLFAGTGLFGQTTVKDSAGIATSGVKITGDVMYIYGNAVANSTAITGKLTNAFIKGGFIGDDIKNTTLDRLKSKNRLGLEVNYGATYVHYSKKTTKNVIGYYLRYNQSLFLGSNFNENHYKLMFYGNSQFAGQTVNISPFRYYMLGQRSLGGGIVLGKNKNSFWVGADVVQGLSHTDIKATDMSLTTAIDGQMLELDGKLDFKQSARPTYNAGYGFALNGQWFTDIKDKVYLNFMVDNLGMVFWNNKAQNFSRDTTLQFSGLDLVDVIQNDSAFDQVTDSLSEALLPSERYKSYNTILPFFVKAVATKYFANGKLRLSAMINYRYVPAYVPQGSIHATYFIKWFSPSLSIMYGGYGGFNTGISLGFDLGKGYRFSAETLLNEGWLVPKSASGIGVGFRFYKSFFRK
jgi:hypothetical protein